MTFPRPRAHPAPLAGFVVLIAACGAEAPSPDIVTSASPPPPPRLVPAREAMERADVTKMHPETMERAAVERTLGRGPGCSFAFTEAGKPVLAVRAAAEPAGVATGVVKLHGRLAQLRAARRGGLDRLRAGADLGAEGIRIAVRPVPSDGGAVSGAREADLEIRLAEGLTRAWRGVYRCSEGSGLKQG